MADIATRRQSACFRGSPTISWKNAGVGVFTDRTIATATSIFAEVACAHLALVERVARASTPSRPCVIVLEHYSVHHSRLVKAATPDLAARAVHFIFLPPYSPEWNPIEAQSKQIKHQDLPERSHPTDVAFQAAVDRALADRARMLHESTHDVPRPA